MKDRPTTDSALAIERRTIDVIPDGERHGTPRNQFTLWFGANMQITAIVDGALAVVFGADAIWAIVGLLIGNVLGGVVMALHSAQGPRLGLPQMISSRAQFGVYGAVVPLLLVVLMYLGFAATGTVLAGQAIGQILHSENPAVGIVVFGALTAVVAVTGYRLIHAIGRIASVVGIIGFSYLAIRLFTEYDVASLVGVKAFDFVTFLLAISLGAGWQLTFGPYVADYSRYLPRSTSDRATFWSTLTGSVIGSSWSMTFGALVAAVAGDAFLDDQVGFIGGLAGPALVVVADLSGDRGRQVDGQLPQCLRRFHVDPHHGDRVQRPDPRLVDRSRRLHRRIHRRLGADRACRQRRLPDQLQELRTNAADGLHSVERNQSHRLLPDLPGTRRHPGALQPRWPVRSLERHRSGLLRDWHPGADSVPRSDSVHRAHHQDARRSRHLLDSGIGSHGGDLLRSGPAHEQPARRDDLSRARRYGDGGVTPRTRLHKGPRRRGDRQPRRGSCDSASCGSVRPRMRQIS